MKRSRFLVSFASAFIDADRKSVHINTSTYHLFTGGGSALDQSPPTPYCGTDEYACNCRDGSSYTVYGDEPYTTPSCSSTPTPDPYTPSDMYTDSSTSSGTSTSVYVIVGVVLALVAFGERLAASCTPAL